jgi:hypothetical protein
MASKEKLTMSYRVTGLRVCEEARADIELIAAMVAASFETQYSIPAKGKSNVTADGNNLSGSLSSGSLQDFATGNNNGMANRSGG